MFLINHIALFLLLIGVIPWVRGVSLYSTELKKRRKFKTKTFSKPTRIAVVKSAILLWTSLLCMLSFIYLFDQGIFKIPMGYTFKATLKITDVEEQLRNHEDFRLSTGSMLTIISTKDSDKKDDYLYDTVDYSLTGKYISLGDVIHYLGTGNPDIVMDSYATENKSTEKLHYEGLVKQDYINEIKVYKVGDFYLSGASIGEVLPNLDLNKPVTLDIIYNTAKVDSSNTIKEYKIVNIITA